ncbi:hypothetical protein CIW48_28495 [Methylobacterium sp. P1-11]|nr:hypothetical protein CIW48_28495 [Methylobacterium sp. P1-11]
MSGMSFNSSAQAPAHDKTTMMVATIVFMAVPSACRQSRHGWTLSILCLADGTACTATGSLPTSQPSVKAPYL